MKRVLYTGSFDPITKGHMNIISQASELFDEVIVAVLQNSKKVDSFFTIEERVQLMKKIYKNKKMNAKPLLEDLEELLILIMKFKWQVLIKRLVIIK